VKSVSQKKVPFQQSTKILTIYEPPMLWIPKFTIVTMKVRFLILFWTRYIQFKVKTGSIIFYNILLRSILPNSHTLATICPRNSPKTIIWYTNGGIQKAPSLLSYLIWRVLQVTS